MNDNYFETDHQYKCKKCGCRPTYCKKNDMDFCLSCNKWSIALTHQEAIEAWKAINGPIRPNKPLQEV